MTARLERWQWLLLLLLPALWCWFTFDATFATDADSYFHVGVPRRMLEDGWLRRLDALPHTTLGDPYPNMYLGQHAALLPLVGLFGVETTLRLGIVLLSSAFAAGLYLVLRRRGVRWPVPWVVLGIVACPLALTYAVFLKGATTFFVLLPWFIDAIWAGARRRAFVLAWLSVYLYVGSTVMIPFVVVHLLVVRWLDGRWELGGLGATVAGIAAGMIVNPNWPEHWGYVYRELRTIFEREPGLIVGEYRGAEWAILSTEQLIQLAGAALLAWGVVLARQLGRPVRMSASAVSGTIAAFGLLAAGMLSGTKMVELFLIVSILTLPQLVELHRPWPRVVPVVAIVLALGSSAWGIDKLRSELGSRLFTHPAEYREMARWLDERTAPREMVVAPWDDMPGLFMYGRDQRYMAGMNVQFLRDRDRKRFEAYALFYRGAISDPEQTMIQFFDGARFVLVRRIPRLPGEPALTDRLARSPAFEELAGPVPTWRVFRRR